MDENQKAALDRIVEIVKTTEEMLGNTSGSPTLGTIAYKHIRKILIDAGLLR